MTAWLLDTNVILELRRPRPEPKVVAYVADKPLDLLFISTVTLAEIRFGIELQEGPARRAEVSATGENTKSPFTSAFKPHSIIGDAKIML